MVFESVGTMPVACRICLGCFPCIGQSYFWGVFAICHRHVRIDYDAHLQKYFVNFALTISATCDTNCHLDGFLPKNWGHPRKMTNFAILKEGR